MNIVLDTLLSYGIPTEYIEMLSSYLFIIALVFVTTSALFAFWGYKIFKIGIAVIGAVSFGILGNMFLTPIIVNFITASFGDGVLAVVNLEAVFGFVFAILGGFLTGLIYKLGIFVMGAAVGYFTGVILAPYIAVSVPQLAILETKIGTIVLGVLCAIISSVIFLSMFRLVFILLSSIGGMSISAVVIGFTIFPEFNKTQLVICLGIGAFVGFIAMIYQFRNSKKEKKKLAKTEYRKKSMHG